MSKGCAVGTASRGADMTSATTCEPRRLPAQRRPSFEFQRGQGSRSCKATSGVKGRMALWLASLG
jgi:hypothetical protein